MEMVTANFERGRAVAWTWLEKTLAERAPAAVFGQELAGGDRLDRLASEHGYVVVWPACVLNPRWQVVSWVMVKEELSPTPLVDPALLDKLKIHQSYVASASVELPGLGAAALVSMHASPNVVPEAELATYPSPPDPRSGGSSRDAGRLFYSDLVVDALADAATRGPVLAAGDLNEARAWDDGHPGETWGTEFFGGLESRGLHDITFGLWGEERRTRFHASHPAYQLDIVLASHIVAPLVVDAAVDDGWTDDAVASEGLSDHAPVWIRIDPLSAG